MTGALAALVLSLSVPIGSTPVRAQEQAIGDITIEINQLSPLAPTIDSVIRISGAITNNSSKPLESLSLSLRVGSPLAGRSEVESTFSSESSSASQQVAVTNLSLPSVIAAGGSGGFSLTTNTRELGFTTAGVYPTSVLISAFQGSSSRLNFAIPYYPLEQSRLNLIAIWPLLGAPAQINDEVAFTQSLPEQLATGGALANTLSSVRTGLNVLADPSILNFARRAQASYLVSDGRASQVGTNSPEIRDWWTKFDAVSRTNSTWLTGFGDPVTWAAKGSRLSNLRKNTYTFAGAELSEFNAQGLVALVTEKFDPESIAFLARQKTSIIISSDLVLPVDLPNYTPSALISPKALGLSETSMPLLISDGQLTRLFTPLESTRSQNDSTKALLVRQQIAADLTLIALERPSTETVVVAVPPPGWRPSKPLAQAAASAMTDGPWAELIPLKSAFDLRLDETPRKNTSPDELRKNEELRPRQIELLKQGQEQIERLKSIIQLPSVELGQLEVALARGLSYSWVAQPKLGRELTTVVNSLIESKYRNVAVVTSSELTLTGQIGALPVTINNDLDAPIRISLGANLPAGISVDLSSLQNLLVQANQATSVDIPIEVQASINAPIELFIENDQGQQVGSSAVISIRTTAYSQVAQWISIAALALLVIFAGMSIGKKITKARRAVV